MGAEKVLVRSAFGLVSSVGRALRAERTRPFLTGAANSKVHEIPLWWQSVQFRCPVGTKQPTRRRRHPSHLGDRLVRLCCESPVTEAGTLRALLLGSIWSGGTAYWR